MATSNRRCPGKVVFPVGGHSLKVEQTQPSDWPIGALSLTYSLISTCILWVYKSKWFFFLECFQLLLLQFAKLAILRVRWPSRFIGNLWECSWEGRHIHWMNSYALFPLPHLALCISAHVKVVWDTDIHELKLFLRLHTITKKGHFLHLALTECC